MPGTPGLMVSPFRGLGFNSRPSHQRNQVFYIDSDLGARVTLVTYDVQNTKAFVTYFGIRTRCATLSNTQYIFIPNIS